MATLAEIRAKLQAQEDQKQGNYSGGGDNVIFPHWNISEGSSAKVRFLPDGDESNTFYWVERLLIKLPFAGVKGDANSKAVTVQVPCMEMWEPVGSCPILSEVRPWFKDPSLEDVARKYWKKRSYFLQGFVHDNGGIDEEAPDNPIRRFTFTPQIFDIVKSALMDPELEELPTDYDNGLDFIINKTSGGQYASYATSKYARKESALTQEERDAIEEHGLFDLKTFLPKKPDEAHLQAIKEMFEASVDGEMYDVERWGQFYKPYGIDAPTTPKAENADDVPSKTVETEDDAPFEADEPEVKTPAPKEEKASSEDTSSGSEKANAILEKIRNRSKA